MEIVKNLRMCYECFEAQIQINIKIFLWNYIKYGGVCCLRYTFTSKQFWTLLCIPLFIIIDTFKSTFHYLFVVCPVKMNRKSLDFWLYIPQKTEVSTKNVLRMFEAHFWKKYEKCWASMKKITILMKKNVYILIDLHISYIIYSGLPIPVNNKIDHTHSC